MQKTLLKCLNAFLFKDEVEESGGFCELQIALKCYFLMSVLSYTGQTGRKSPVQNVWVFMYVVSLLTHLKMPFSDSPLSFFLTLFIPLLWVFSRQNKRQGKNIV